MSLGSLGSVVSHGCEGGEEIWVVFCVFFFEFVFGGRCGFGPMTPKRHACFFCSQRRSDERSRTTLRNRHPSSKRSAIEPFGE